MSARRRLELAWVWVVPVLLLAVGAEMRLRQWLGGRSLWLDEATLADSFLDHTSLQLVTTPLDGGQGAPVGWLLATRADLSAFGTDAQVLRLVPLLSGLVSLGLFWLLARQLLPRAVVPLAVLLFVGSPSLLYYANEAKQYSSDVAVALLVLVLAVQALGRQRPRLWPLTAVGVVGVWCSHPAVFVLGGASLVLVLAPAVRRDLREAARRAVLLLPWVLSFAASYVLVLRRLQDSTVLARYWGPTYPRGPGDLGWPVRRLLALADNPLHWALPVLGLLLTAYGAVLLARRDARAAAALLACGLVGTVAAAVRAYPLADRLALWLVPVVLLALAGGVPAGRGPVARAGALVVVVLLGLLVGPQLVTTAALTVHRTEVEELEPVIDQVRRERLPGDLLAVHAGAATAYRFYDHIRPGVASHLYLDLVRSGRGCSDDQRLRAAGFTRAPVWVFFSHSYRNGPDTDPAAATEQALRGVAHVEQRIVRHGASAELFVPDASPRPRERAGPTCLVVRLLAVPL